jgi:hypothetical protein
VSPPVRLLLQSISSHLRKVVQDAANKSFRIPDLHRCLMSILTLQWHVCPEYFITINHLTSLIHREVLRDEQEGNRKEAAICTISSSSTSQLNDIDSALNKLLEVFRKDPNTPSPSVADITNCKIIIKNALVARNILP